MGIVIFSACKLVWQCGAHNEAVTGGPGFRVEGVFRLVCRCERVKCLVRCFMGKCQVLCWSKWCVSVCRVMCCPVWVEGNRVLFGIIWRL